MLKQDNKWLDPRDFKSEKEFLFAYAGSWGKASAFLELVTMLSNADDRAREIAGRLEKEKLKNGITPS